MAKKISENIKKLIEERLIDTFHGQKDVTTEIRDFVPNPEAGTDRIRISTDRLHDFQEWKKKNPKVEL